jgi:hypothetical protein
MRQIVHIFRKDVRHHWPEILLSLALLVAYAMEQPRTWTGQLVENRFLAGVVNSLPALMVLAWAFLIVRLVQGETLVGDRQFWITRPYEWPKLLLAKLLSILLFFHAPLFIAQLVLLKVAHFPVLASIRGLIHIHVLLAATLVLAALALAVITAGIGQAALALLLVVLFIVGVALLAFATHPEADLTGGTDAIDGLLFWGCCLAVILIQFVYRKTLLSRLIVTATALLVLLIFFVTPYGKLMDHEFPLPTAAHALPAKFVFDHALSFAHFDDQKLNSFGDEVDLELPFQLSGISDEVVFQIRAIKLDLELPSGDQWSSHWTRLYDEVSPGRTRAWTHINMKKTVFKRIKDVPVKAHVSLGFNVFGVGRAIKVVMTGDRVSIPGGAWCLNDSSENMLKCFSALEEPEPMFIVANLPNSSCRIAREDIAAEMADAPAVFAALSNDSSPDAAFSPIQQFSIQLSRYYSYEDLQARLPICAGTPLLVSKPEFRYAVRDELDLGNITLFNYLPNYPRTIVPPRQRRAPDNSANNLSSNLGPDMLADSSSRTGHLGRAQ